MNSKPKYLSITALRKRGWNDELINQLLGPPDKTATNPNYRSGPLMKLYEEVRVLGAEESQQFQEKQRKFRERSIAAKSAAQTRKNTTLTLAKTIKVELPQINLDTLKEEAIKNYNDIHCEKEGKHITEFQLAPWEQEDQFRDRICVNYLRHVATIYDESLQGIKGRTGKEEARLIIFEVVTEQISETFPELANEAERQLEERQDKYYLGI